MITVELEEVQSFILRDFALEYSDYYITAVEDSPRVKEWINKQSTTLTHGRSDVDKTGFNIAFTYHGLKQLGLHEENLRNFSTPFREGMDTDHRNRMLGDIQSSAPDHWKWGGKQNEKVDVLVLLFADTKEELDKLKRSLIDESGLKVLHRLSGIQLPV